MKAYPNVQLHTALTTANTLQNLPDIVWRLEGAVYESGVLYHNPPVRATPRASFFRAFLKESSAKNFHKGLLKSKTARTHRFAVSETRLSPSALLWSMLSSRLCATYRVPRKRNISKQPRHSPRLLYRTAPRAVSRQGAPRPHPFGAARRRLITFAVRRRSAKS